MLIFTFYYSKSLFLYYESEKTAELWAYESLLGRINNKIIKSFCVFDSSQYAWHGKLSNLLERKYTYTINIDWGGPIFSFSIIFSTIEVVIQTLQWFQVLVVYMNVWVIVYIMLFLLYSKLKHTKAKWMTTIHNPIQTQQPDKRAHNTIWLNYMYTL